MMYLSLFLAHKAASSALLICCAAASATPGAAYSSPHAAKKLRRGLALEGSSTCSQQSLVGL